MTKQDRHEIYAIPDRFELDGYDRRTDPEIRQFQGRAAEAVVTLLKHKLRGVNGGVLPERWTERLVRTPPVETDKDGLVTYRFNRELLLTVSTTIRNNSMTIELVTDHGQVS